MIVRDLDDVTGTERDVETPNWRSRRLLLRRDGMGFSMHDTTILAGTATRMHYRHHLEAVYCIEGRGALEDLETGVRHPLRAGTLYALDGHERHVLHAETRMRMVCVFNPPLSAREVHDEDGVYPLVDGAAPPLTSSEMR